MGEDRSHESEGFVVALDGLLARIGEGSASGSSSDPSPAETSLPPQEDAAALLRALEVEERELSNRRRQLHIRIDSLEAAPTPLNLTFVAQLNAFKRAEVVVSANRRMLHRQIDTLSGSRPTATPSSS